MAFDRILGQCQCHNIDEEPSQPSDDGTELAPINPRDPDHQVSEESQVLLMDNLDKVAVMDETVAGGKF